jgi:hypothetical protein
VRSEKPGLYEATVEAKKRARCAAEDTLGLSLLFAPKASETVARSADKQKSSKTVARH